ncbi:MAG: adenylate/guanylate cyclase domain-containing protein [Elainellaceae cyanobacterium]
MTQLSLKRLLRKKDIQFVLDQLAGAIAHPFCIQDTSGQVQMGTELASLPNRYPIELDGQCLGWVLGYDDSAAIAHLLSMLAHRELSQKQLARETLDRYKEITLLYDISEKITAQLDLQSVAELVLEEARKIIPGDRGAVILHQLEPGATARSVTDRVISDDTPELDGALVGVMSTPTPLGNGQIGNSQIGNSQKNAEPQEGVALAAATDPELVPNDRTEAGTFEAIAHFGLDVANPPIEGVAPLLSTIPAMPVEMTPGAGILGQVFSSGNGEIVNHVQGDRRCQQAEQGYDALVCAPLKTQERVLGLIVLGSSGSRKGLDSSTLTSYSAGDLKLLNALASQAAAAIENALLHKKELREARIKSNLERYVPAQLVQAILEAKDDISLAPNRKNITILFSDIRNFTSHCERLEPELIVGYLNEYFSHMVDIIFTHEGTVNKFVGDMIVALFGAPSPMPASEQQAIETAIAMQRCIQSFPLAWIRDNFHTGIGLSAGRVIVGNIGSPQHSDYTAIGDEVNTASRLQAIAKGGQILVSRNVYEATRHLFSFKSMGTLTLKGKRRAIEVFEVQY